MEAVGFQALVDQLSGLTAGQRAALIEAVRAKASASDAVSLIDRRFATRWPNRANRIELLGERLLEHLQYEPLITRVED